MMGRKIIILSVHYFVILIRDLLWLRPGCSPRRNAWDDTENIRLADSFQRAANSPVPLSTAYFDLLPALGMPYLPTDVTA